jgi:hypothetical protein
MTSLSSRRRRRRGSYLDDDEQRATDSRHARHQTRLRERTHAPVVPSICLDAAVDRDAGASDDKGSTPAALEERGDVGCRLSDGELGMGRDVGRRQLGERWDRDADHGWRPTGSSGTCLKEGASGWRVVSSSRQARDRRGAAPLSDAARFAPPTDPAGARIR